MLWTKHTRCMQKAGIPVRCWIGLFLANPSIFLISSRPLLHHIASVVSLTVVTGGCDFQMPGSTPQLPPSPQIHVGSLCHFSYFFICSTFVSLGYTIPALKYTKCWQLLVIKKLVSITCCERVVGEELLLTSCCAPWKYALVSAVVGHMGTVRQLFSYRGNSSSIISEYHIGSFRGYGAKMDDR